jgi:hypothetical protein
LLEKPPCECSNCGATKLVREEHTVQWKGSLGHVDEILLLDKKSKSVYILDYKTTSLSNVNKPDPAGYLAQISSYAVALKDSGYKVVGYALVYIPRDNPFKFRVSPYVFDEAAEYKARKRLTGWKESFDSASKVKSLDSALRLLDTRPCEHGLKAAHAECPHASNCAGQGARPENMVFLINKTHKSLGTFLPVRK